MIASLPSHCHSNPNREYCKSSIRTVSTVSLSSDYLSIRSQDEVEDGRSSIRENDFVVADVLRSRHPTGGHDESGTRDRSSQFSIHPDSTDSRGSRTDINTGSRSEKSFSSVCDGFYLSNSVTNSLKGDYTTCVTNAGSTNAPSCIEPSKILNTSLTKEFFTGISSNPPNAECQHDGSRAGVEKSQLERDYNPSLNSRIPPPPIISCPRLSSHPSHLLLVKHSSAALVACETSRILCHPLQVLLQVVTATFAATMGLVRHVGSLRNLSVFRDTIETVECDNNKLSLQEIVGDYGLALFSPLHEGAFPPLEDAMRIDQTESKKESRESDDTTDDTSDDDLGYVFKHEIYPVEIDYESESILQTAPRILSDSMFQQIVDEAIPGSLRMYKWKRIFAIARDGDAFITMMEKCASFKYTLMAIKTTDGHILGGFASEQWKNQDGFDKRNSYFGTGACFLFSDHPKNPNPDKEITTYRWTGVNDYCQICDVDNRKIAMGGGEGDFGLIVEDSFLRGSSGHCATFCNPPLIPGIDGSFDILEFEIYGMLPLIPAVTRPKISKYSNCSLLKKE